MEVIMRTPKDRLRHTLLFEACLLAIVVPAMSFVFDTSAGIAGALSISMSLIAMTLNYVYNWAFDHALVRMGKPLAERSTMLRVIHSLLFEGFLLFFTVPLIMTVLDMTLFQALVLDIGFVVFVPCYAFAFNIAYDKAFPLPVAREVD